MRACHSLPSKLRLTDGTPYLESLSWVMLPCHLKRLCQVKTLPQHVLQGIMAPAGSVGTGLRLTDNLQGGFQASPARGAVDDLCSPASTL